MKWLYHNNHENECLINVAQIKAAARKIPLTFDHVQYFQETFYHERMLQDQRKSQVKHNGCHKQEKTWKHTKIYASALAHNNEAKHSKYLK
jgi:hypothetical protein